MTINFKPGQHPDADQLSAFIEQALPAHERDGVLAHLAVCAECRTVVALALPEVPVAVPAPGQPRAWFTGWMVFVPAAAAVAALAAFVFFVNRESPAPQQQAQVAPLPVTAAPGHPQTTPESQLKAAPSATQSKNATPVVSPSAGREAEAVSSANGSVFVEGSAGAAMPSANAPAAIEPAAPQVAVAQNQPVQSVQSLPAQSAAASFAPSASNAVASKNQSTDQATAARGNFHGGAIAGTFQSSNSLQQNENYKQNDANVQNRQEQNGVQQTASQTVQVQAEAPVMAAATPYERDNRVGGALKKTFAIQSRPVPSGLQVLSSAIYGPMVLAIDTQHSVFASNDLGQHWKTVQAVWKGHAVKVQAVASFGVSSNVPEWSGDMESFQVMPQDTIAARKAGLNLTGTVTDQSGAVVPGATVAVTDPQTHLTRTISTDSKGRYAAAGLAPGEYGLEVTAQGFKNSWLSNVAVTASNENVANVTLSVAAASESVTVEASEASVEPKAVLKPKVAAVAKVSSPALFEIVTDKGAHWTSADGLIWKPE